MISLPPSLSVLARSRCEAALDLVHTRTCRIDSSNGNGDDDGETTMTPVRFLAPVFDLINHDRDPNAEFIREGDSFDVRATRDISNVSQILISYGPSLTAPKQQVQESFCKCGNSKGVESRK